MGTHNALQFSAFNYLFCFYLVVGCIDTVKKYIFCNGIFNDEFPSPYHLVLSQHCDIFTCDSKNLRIPILKRTRTTRVFLCKQHSAFIKEAHSEKMSAVVTLFPLAIIILSIYQIQAQGCQQNNDKWICKNVNLEAGKRLQINSGNLKVTNIDFEDCNIPTVPLGVFTFFGSVIEVDFSHSKVQSVVPGAFDGLSNLEKLYLQDNSIMEVKPGSVNSLPKLKELNLHRNRISSIDKHCFSNMNSLELLRLGWNNLKFIPENSFENLKNLKHLFLNNNQIRRLAVGSFRNLPSLFQLEIDHNLLTNLEFGTIEAIPKLRIFRLNHNNFTIIQEDVFYASNAIDSLYISNNKITSIDAQKLVIRMPNLAKIELNNNSWTCTSLLHTIQIFKNHTVSIDDNTTEFASNVFGIGCKSEEKQIKENSDTLNALENYFNGDFLNSSFYKYFEDFRKFTTEKNLTYNYMKNVFLEYFENDFKNTTFFKYFDQDFSSSGFFKQFNEAFSKLLREIHSLDGDFKNSSLYKFIDSGRLGQEFSNYFGDKFENSSFYKYFANNFTNLEFFRYFNKTLQAEIDTSLQKLRHYFDKDFRNSTFYNFFDENSSLSLNRKFLKKFGEHFTNFSSGYNYQAESSNNFDTVNRKTDLGLGVEMKTLKIISYVFMMTVVTILLVIMFLLVFISTRRYKTFLAQSTEHFSL